MPFIHKAWTLIHVPSVTLGFRHKLRIFRLSTLVFWRNISTALQCSLCGTESTAKLWVNILTQAQPADIHLLWVSLEVMHLRFSVLLNLFSLPCSANQTEDELPQLSWDASVTLSPGGLEKADLCQMRLLQHRSLICSLNSS